MSSIQSVVEGKKKDFWKFLIQSTRFILNPMPVYIAPEKLFGIFILWLLYKTLLFSSE